jgi:hypothetical protein
MVKYLLLGEGDFTYTFDLLRFLNNNSSSSSKDDSAVDSVVATSFDTDAELCVKYKDWKALAKKLNKFAPRLELIHVRLSISFYLLPSL